MLAITTKPMNLINNRYFWALLVVVTGLSLSLVQVFEFAIPVFRLVVTIFLVTAGIQLILKSTNFKSKVSRPTRQSFLIGSGTNVITFSKVKSRYYNVLGSQIIDLRSLNPARKLTINIYTWLGETHLYLPAIPTIQITSHKQFGHITGSLSFERGESANPKLLLDLHTIMGNVTIHREEEAS